MEERWPAEKRKAIVQYLELLSEASHAPPNCMSRNVAQAIEAARTRRDEKELTALWRIEDDNKAT